MIMTTAELRQYIDTQEEDQALEARLQALEVSIKGYTNNSFTRIIEQNGGEWPMDIKMGVVDMLRWKMSAGRKVGISAETLSRHSVTYESMTADNAAMGYPKALTAFLKPYMRARFGKGYFG